jgi:BON domain
MKPINSLTIGALSLAAAISLSPTLFAQENAPAGGSGNSSSTAATSPQSAPAGNGTNTTGAQQFKQSVSDVATATKNEAKLAYDKTKVAVKDTTVTAKAKEALAENKSTSSASHSIHVKTEHGIVTLSGDVDSLATAQSATQVVGQLNGVKKVNNELRTSTAPASGANAGAANASRAD